VAARVKLSGMQVDHNVPQEFQSKPLAMKRSEIERESKNFSSTRADELQIKFICHGSL
jgi:hypothetical protein